MERKSAERHHWPRVLKKRFLQQSVEEADFRGIISINLIDEVRSPAMPTWTGRPICIADNGYSWLQHYTPDEPHHVVTTMFNEYGEIVQWYIDIVRSHWLDERGVPWFDDLYLDIVRLPDGQLYLVDEDELEEALAAGVITQEEYDLAYREARRLMELLGSGTLPSIARSRSDRERLLATT